MKNMEKLLVTLNPAISKYGLLVLAGLMWSGVGIMLSAYAFGWLTGDLSWLMLALGITGILLSWIVNRYGFSKVALKNIERILLANERACLFSFQEWKGYLIIAVMMTTGILLRSSPIPKPYLAVLYLTIGGALFQASFSYYARFCRLTPWKKMDLQGDL